MMHARSSRSSIASHIGKVIAPVWSSELWSPSFRGVRGGQLARSRDVTIVTDPGRPIQCGLAAYFCSWKRGLEARASLGQLSLSSWNYARSAFRSRLIHVRFTIIIMVYQLTPLVYSAQVRVDLAHTIRI